MDLQDLGAGGDGRHLGRPTDQPGTFIKPLLFARPHHFPALGRPWHVKPYFKTQSWVTFLASLNDSLPFLITFIDGVLTASPGSGGPG